MNILVLGNSNIFQRRVLPALTKLDVVTNIEVASQSGPGRWQDYGVALVESQAAVVYISLVNRLHFEWAKKALNHGYHVIIDKPATTTLAEAEELINLAQEKQLCLAEATVYAYHPQISTLQNLGQAHTLMVNFSFPPMPGDNYRYSFQAGGGAIEDLGTYALTPGRLFFKAQPLEIKAVVTADNGQVPLAFSFLAVYPDRQTLIGHCGFNSEYINRLQVLGQTLNAEVNRVFSTPAEMNNMIHYHDQHLDVPAADAFEIFLQKVLLAIQKQNWQSFSDDLLHDAQALEMLRQAV